jgi:hypothetical protein
MEIKLSLAPPDAVQLDKLMVDILSGQVVNKSDGRTMMLPKPARIRGAATVVLRQCDEVRPE